MLTSLFTSTFLDLDFLSEASPLLLKKSLMLFTNLEACLSRFFTLSSGKNSLSPYPSFIHLYLFISEPGLPNLSTSSPLSSPASLRLIKLSLMESTSTLDRLNAESPLPTLSGTRKVLMDSLKSPSLLILSTSTPKSTAVRSFLKKPKKTSTLSSSEFQSIIIYFHSNKFK